MRLLTILLLCIVAAGCGYGTHATTPPTPASTPTINTLNPNAVIAGSAAFALEVDGANFNSTAVVNFNGTAMTTTFVTGAKLTANVPASAITNAGTVPVTVTNPGTPGTIYGGGTTAVTSAPMNFMIN